MVIKSHVLLFAAVEKRHEAIQHTWIVAMSNRCWDTIAEVTMAWMPYSSLQRCIYPAPKFQDNRHDYLEIYLLMHEVYDMRFS